jgi:hypothetical protein
MLYYQAGKHLLSLHKRKKHLENLKMPVKRCLHIERNKTNSNKGVKP